MSETPRDVFAALLDALAERWQTIVSLESDRGHDSPSAEVERESAGERAEWLARFDAAGGWIPVEERLPEAESRVWAWERGKGGVEAMVGGAGDPRGWIAVATYLPLHEVTHWRPLPEPPT